MNAPDLLRWAEAEGVHLWGDGDLLRAEADHPPPAELVRAMRANKAELLALLATTPANDHAPASHDLGINIGLRASSSRPSHSTVSAAGPVVFILTYEVDGKQATCRDSVSATVAEAVADLQAMYGQRLGRVWCQGACYDENDTARTGSASSQSPAP